MTWKPIDFRGIVILDKPFIDQIARFLEEKESQLAIVVGQAVPTPLGKSQPPLAAPTVPAHIKLNDNIEQLARIIREIGRSPIQTSNETDWEFAASQINSALWAYLEALEGCVTELFQQIEQVGFEQWHSELLEVVIAIKDMLLHHMEEFVWGFRRIDSLLKEYRKICLRNAHWWANAHNLIRSWGWVLDSTLLSNLMKTRKFLKFRYKAFADRYNAHREMMSKIDQQDQKFADYAILQANKNDIEDKFKKIYRFVKLWEINKSTRALPEQDPVRALRSLTTPDKAYGVYRDYCQELKEVLFQGSRAFKLHPDDYRQDAEGKLRCERLIAGARMEIHTLGATVSKYRDFLLRTDPNPYVRSRLGFAEWIVGPEPQQTKQFLHLGYELEDLDAQYIRLSKSLEKGVPQRGESLFQLNQDLQIILHEMGQPLTSRSLMRVRAERIVQHLQQLDELGSFNPYVVDFIGQILAKALRTDWKYHVFQEIPGFHKLYFVHLGIVGPVEDRHHANRLHKFKRLTHQIEQWVMRNDTQKHAHDIESDMNDIKEYLQDFFAYVQRTGRDANMDQAAAMQTVNDIAQMLLEYRYLFGSFFHRIRQNEPEHKLIRNQFLFVDQYFETIENKLHEMRQSVGRA